MSEENFRIYDRNLIEFLMSLVEIQDLGALAGLRRGLGKTPGSVAEMHQYIVPFLNPKRPWDDSIYYLIAALFAWHQINWESKPKTITNLGASLALMLNENNKDGINRRFSALLNSHFDDLSTHLRQIIGLLKSKVIPIDWLQLLNDLRFWNHDRRIIQLRWAKAFWTQNIVETAKD